MLYPLSYERLWATRRRRRVRQGAACGRRNGRPNPPIVPGGGRAVRVVSGGIGRGGLRTVRGPRSVAGGGTLVGWATLSVVSSGVERFEAPGRGASGASLLMQMHYAPETPGGATTVGE